MGIDPKVISGIINRDIIDILRESESLKGHRAWFGVNSILNDDWNNMCEKVANNVIKAIEAKPLCEDEDRLVEQMRKLRCSIDSFAKVIEITFGHRDRSVSEILKRGL